MVPSQPTSRHDRGLQEAFKQKPVLSLYSATDANQLNNFHLVMPHLVDTIPKRMKQEQGQLFHNWKIECERSPPGQN